MSARLVDESRAPGRLIVCTTGAFAMKGIIQAVINPHKQKRQNPFKVLPPVIRRIFSYFSKSLFISQSRAKAFGIS